jgi:hypothetical protein
MAVNRDKPDRWKEDIACSVDMYNEWFMNFAPAAFRETRVRTTRDVEKSLSLTDNLFNIKPEPPLPGKMSPLLFANPGA